MPGSPSTYTSEVAVVYLARYAEGPGPVAAFVDSLERHAPGMAHESVAIRKGFPAGETPQDKILKRAFPHSVSISDDGFDITAYAKAAAQLPHKYVVFFNTFSEIAADDWLRKLHAAFADPAMGIAGATGSYESPLSSMKRVQKGVWLFQTQGVPKPAGVKRLFRALRALLPKRLATRLVSTAISYFSARSTKPGGDPRQDEQFQAYWASEIGHGGSLARLGELLAFPNPHIRSNAFMMERQIFVDTLPSLIETKNDSYLFESGPDSLTQQVLRRGLRVVVVGKDGSIYEMDQWAESGTFRLGSQHNLLVKDNQTRAFEAMNVAEQSAFATMAWGEERVLHR